MTGRTVNGGVRQAVSLTWAVLAMMTACGGEAAPAGVDAGSTGGATDSAAADDGQGVDVGLAGHDGAGASADGAGPDVGVAAGDTAGAGGDTAGPAGDVAGGGDGAASGGDSAAGCAQLEACNGLDDDCDGLTDEQSPCDNDDPCVTGAQCVAGACQGGAPKVCTSANPCVEGSCVPTKGCVYSGLTGPCDDGDLCTTGDTCASGFCAGTYLTCADTNACTTDSCKAGQCQHDPLPDDTPCDMKKVCIAGACVPDGTMYAHTSSALYKLDLKTKSFSLVAAFSFDKSGGSVTDIALNRDQNLYAVTFGDLFVCTTATAKCSWQMKLPTSFNGLTFVPIGTVFADQEALIGIANNGGWHLIDFKAAKPSLKQLGSYGSGYTSSGDAFSVLGIGTFATVKKGGVSGDVLVKVDPKTGKVLQDLGAIGASDLYGFAWFDGVFYGFAASGQVWDIDVGTGKGKLLGGFSIPKVSWWGAGVSTEIAP